MNILISLKLFADLFVCNKNIAERIARQIEGLAGGCADNGVVLKFRACLRQYHVTAGVVKVKVNLVREHIEAMLYADLSKFFQLLRCP